MITITIDKQYKIPENWDEVTLSKAIEIYKIPLPEKLKEYYDLKLAQKPLVGISQTDLIKTFPIYYGEILEVFGIPKEIVKKIKPIDRSAFYNAYLMEFVLGLHYSPTYEVKRLEYIEYGEKLYFPEFKHVLGEEIPMGYVTALEFAETADLQIYAQDLAEGKYKVAANIASIICRPKGEPYHEATCLKRAEKMQDMKMSDVWEVFFCLIELLNTQTEHDLRHLKATLTQRLKVPLKQQALVVGRTQLSKWGKRFKGLKM